jgi:hypothetical protein
MTMASSTSFKYFDNLSTTIAFEANVPHDDSPWRGKNWLLGLPNGQERWPLDQVPPNTWDRHKPYIAFINT